jgi:6-pyruvoyltetrahydropterin/6-carboxytetrahydropterin synthase
MIQLTKRYRFCASHRLHSKFLSDVQNKETYGKCNNPHGHGHDYVIEITLSGRIDPATGRLARVECLDQLVEREVVARFDHRNLNEEIPEMAGVVPTTENLVLEIARRLRDSWHTAFQEPSPALQAIRIYETPRNIFGVIYL